METEGNLPLRLEITVCFPKKYVPVYNILFMQPWTEGCLHQTRLKHAHRFCLDLCVGGCMTRLEERSRMDL